MANFNPKAQGTKPKAAPVGGFFDQLKGIGGGFGRSLAEDLLRPLPGETLRQFGLAPEAGLREQVLFDGTEARKKAEKVNAEKANQLKIASLQQELFKMAEQEKHLKAELTEISTTVVQIAKSVDIETPHGIEKIPPKPGVYHKVFYLRILEDFRKKADEAKEWRRAQQVRVTSKPPRGVLVWLGDQKKVHEAGAMFLLQG